MKVLQWNVRISSKVFLVKEWTHTSFIQYNRMIFISNIITALFIMIKIKFIQNNFVGGLV